MEGGLTAAINSLYNENERKQWLERQEWARVCMFSFLDERRYSMPILWWERIRRIRAVESLTSLLEFEHDLIAETQCSFDTAGPSMKIAAAAWAFLFDLNAWLHGKPAGSTCATAQRQRTKCPPVIVISTHSVGYFSAASRCCSGINFAFSSTSTFVKNLHFDFLINEWLSSVEKALCCAKNKMSYFYG